MHITTSKELVLSLIDGEFAFPGGYPKYWVTKDGSCLCYKCLAPHKALGGKALHVNPSAIDALDNPNSDTQWEVVGCDINWEDTWLVCEECSKRIPSAYCEDVFEALEELRKLDPNGWATFTDGSLSSLQRYYDSPAAQLEAVREAIRLIKAQE